MHLPPLSCPHISALTAILPPSITPLHCRHVCRGARVNTLSSNVFWFGRPALLLHPIKYLLFLCAFIIGSTVSLASWKYVVKIRQCCPALP